MRLIEDTLSVIGAVALGIVLGFWVLLLFHKPHGGDSDYSALLFVMVSLFCGVPLGAILGCACAVWSIARRRTAGTGWNLATWTGTAFGLIVGLAAAPLWIAPSFLFGDALPSRWVRLLLTAAFATLGAILANILAGIWKMIFKT
jgi:hypothetical protein